ncbi:energy-coupling factor transporter ATPase [Acidilutibacter cellobiosedens]|uniref:Energy-coupling factor transporter ATPase n=2 Tax=Tissierellia TaxID=1737404 RepID=A0A410QEZ6_9FIRM|nr:energy-coupling factor transporter ATPase [Tissierellaceae bacterium]QAT62643.1 energy-coupling factor transporter ATPase [Acidilutibacter cellobiosedens]SCL90248.1 Energy-coupling factor transporter ATP-binding protein EcfA1 [Sporanaerobacter sp. PP17-6a]
MSNIMIEMKDVTYEYTSDDEEKFQALKGVDLDIYKGEFLAILGHNGSGKSTLAKMMNALLLPTTGRVFVNGMDTRDESKVWDIRQTAGMVFQNPDNQLVATIVEEDVAFGPENQGVPPKEIRKRVDESLETVEMSKYKKHAPHLLSGGQKQRVAIAGILAMNPECIILDEPTAMLDPIGRKEVISTVKKLNKTENKTIVLITHYMDEAVEADRIIVMEDGNIVMDGTPRQIFSEVEKVKKIGLDVPQVTELAYELRQEGINVPKDILTVEELVEAL